MPTYICEKCGCIDNTACGGNYWLVQCMRHKNYSNPFFKDDYANKHVLCTECTPSEFYDGSANPNGGKWHNKFPKKHWSEYGNKEELINLCKKGKGDVINAIEYFKDE